MLLILYIVLFNIYSEGDDTIQLVPLEKISRNIKKKIRDSGRTSPCESMPFLACFFRLGMLIDHMVCHLLTFCFIENIT